MLVLGAATAFAGGPRWSSGKPYFTNSDGKPVVWFTTSPLYFTDPGDLSASVNHAAADALVADAAGTWNTSVSSIVLAQGGALDEHVSSANVSVGSNGPVFPTDVQPANGPAKQIAVIYDSDGSVTDLLLGGGASDPGNCGQTAVTESVDSIAPSNLIMHAILVLNGRCTGTDPELQLEMKYRLIRAFGRVLGLAWSQANDNVFTGSPQASHAQGLNWPLMHPIDILCGPYAYQCLQQPFTLRPDDMASIAAVYPSGVTGNGKVPAYSVAGFVTGTIKFSNGQGMQGVNVLVRRQHPATNRTDAYDLVSSVSGYRFQRIGGNPVTPKGTSLAVSFGWPTQMEGTFDLAWIPIPAGEFWNNMLISTEPVNPLYTGQYAVGPYAGSQVTPSGGTLTATATVVGRGSYVSKTLVATNGAGACTSATDGTEAAPTEVVGSGEWEDTLCGYGHTAWSGLAVRAGTTLTIEVMARDEQGLATTGKVQPVIGVWAATDATGTLPTVGSVAGSMNTATLGLTAVTIANAATQRLRVGIGDVRGDGRPDYAYGARVLYADSIAPSAVPANGGQVTISGRGFRTGNTVTMSGVPAQVLSWTPTAIVAIAPAMSGSTPVDVAVTDLSTGGQTTISGGLVYGPSTPDVLSVVSAPPDGGLVGTPAATGFAVRVVLADGVTPAAGVSVTVSASGAALGGCAGGARCILTTDSNGKVLTQVTPAEVGTVVLTASIDTSSVTSSFTTAASPVDVLHVTSLPSGVVYAGIPATAPFTVKVTLPDGVTPAAGINVALSAVGASLGGCGGMASCSLVADGTGQVSTNVTPVAAGIVSLQASAGGGSASASFTVVVTPVDVLRVVSLPADGSYAGRQADTPFALQVLLGDGVTPASGAALRVSASQGTLGACGVAVCVVTADAHGMVSTSVTPAMAGWVGLTASAGGGSVSSSFTTQAVPPDVLRLVSLPANGANVGVAAATPFAMQILLGDGITPANGVAATFVATGGTLGACGAASCVILSDATGLVSTTVTPAVLGTVGLKASAGGGSISVSFSSAAAKLRVISQPAAPVYVGVPAATAFSAQVFLADGVTPSAGAEVSLSATLAGLSSCGGASTCVLTTDASGVISTVVTPNAAGVVILTASAGGGTVSATFEAINPVRLISVTRAVEYVAPGAVVSWTPQVSATGNGLPAAGLAVQWTTGAGMSLAALSSTFDPAGRASVGAVIGPLATGDAPTGEACAWVAVCVSFGAQVVDAPEWRLTVVSGGGQNVTAGESLQPVVLRAMDPMGHWIAGVPVEVHQVVDASVACPSTGRCPIAPVLGSASGVLVSDVDGLLTLAPMQVDGTAEVTKVVAAAGSNGFLSISLTKTP